MASGNQVEVEGHRLALSNLDKALYPSGFTKAEIIDYYARVAPTMLVHLAGRPLTLKRYPNGTTAQFFYEKNCPRHRPDWVRTVDVPRRHDSTEMIGYCVADDVATLVWLANLAAIELHPLLARAEDVGCPTVMVFDLDPGPPAAMGECAVVACEIRDLLAGWDLEAYPKTSGSKGLQLYVPVNGPTSYDVTKPLAHRVAVELAKATPERIVERMDKGLRQGKVLIDWSQNHPTKTTVCAYSLRALEEPRVSTPLSWAEVEDQAGGGREPLAFGPAEVLSRLESDGDLFAPVASQVQVLPKV
jgi:bifunctional non-homologous end joining protein LigD